MIFQRTLKKPVSVCGIGLHSGKATQVTLKPARANRGVVFVRTDLEGSPEIVAHYKNVVSTQLATTLGRGSITVGTVEHVLAALQGMDIDNAIVEVDGPEVPVMDGSSAAFCEAIERAGTEYQLQPRVYLALRRRVEVKLAEKWAAAEPSSRLEIHASIDWDHPSIGYQEFHYVEGRTPFSELASARTFCLLRDVEMMRSLGLIKGGSLDNAVVLDHALVLNPEGLRYQDELVRHKVLDALGDFKLGGIGLQCYVRLHRAGHDLHSQLMSAIFRDPDNYEIIEGVLEEEARIPAMVRPALAQARLATTF